LKVISEGGILVITGVTENGAYLTRVDTNTTLSGLNIKDRFTLKGELNRVAGEELKKALMCINSVTELRDIVGEFNLNKPIIYRNQLNQLSSNVAYTSDRAIELKLLMVIGNLGLDRIVEKEVFKMAHIYLNARRSDVPFRTDYGFKIEGVIYTPKKKPWDSFTLVQKVLLRSISEMKEQSLNATPELRARLIKRIAEVTAIYNNNVTPVTPISSQV
jgi:hypothetical protein